MGGTGKDPATGLSSLLVVTDLDASLLDESYAWSAARPALARLRAADIPLVLNSSKTVDEITDLAQEMGMSSPLVAENGGLLAVPDARGAYRIELTGLSREYILKTAHALRAEAGYPFAGFSDWTPEQVVERTGLSLEAARRSQARHATEPILWEGSEANLQAFSAALAESQIRIVKGGRFFHLMGRVDKADGSAAVLRMFQKARPDVQWTVVALGDSENDRAMLEAADIAVVIPHDNGLHVAPKAPKVIYAPMPSSRGWNAAIHSLLDEFC